MDADFDIRFTDRPITPFGGLTTVKNFYQNSGLKEVISSLPLPQPGSNRGYDPVDLIEGFLISVMLGGSRDSNKGTERKLWPGWFLLRRFWSYRGCFSLGLYCL